jgi:hypothetical protein
VPRTTQSARTRFQRRRHLRVHGAGQFAGKLLRPLHRPVPDGEPLDRALCQNRPHGQTGQPAGTDQQGGPCLARGQIPERQGDGRRRAQIGEVAVLFENQGRNAGGSIEQDEHAVGRGQAPLSIGGEPRSDLEHDES